MIKKKYNKIRHDHYHVFFFINMKTYNFVVIRRRKREEFVRYPIVIHNSINHFSTVYLLVEFVRTTCITFLEKRV